MDQNFKKQLVERQEYVESLLKEMKEKEKEFQEYCRQVEIDRKFRDGGWKTSRLKLNLDLN